MDLWGCERTNFEEIGCRRNVVSEINVANTHDSKGNSKQLCGKEQRKDNIQNFYKVQTVFFCQVKRRVVD